MFLRYLTFFGFILAIAVTSTNCRRGCMQDEACISNYNAKAKKPGTCRGCIDTEAWNYCNVAEQDDGSCVYVRRFFTQDTFQGWYDLWVSDSAFSSNLAHLSFEGRVHFTDEGIPDCETAENTLDVTRPAGEYYYEYETQRGELNSGWVIFREEYCRLQVLPIQ